MNNKHIHPSAEAALAELIALDDLGNAIKTAQDVIPGVGTVNEALAEYFRRKPVAWANARLALSAPMPATQAPAAVGLTDMREAFESDWYNTYHSGSIRARADGTYMHPAVDRAWDSWQRAWNAALSAPMPAGAAVGGWQPIETAPKDGLVDILLPSGRRYADCHYDKICSEYRHITACGVLVRLGKASHWMRPPAPPLGGASTPTGGAGS